MPQRSECLTTYSGVVFDLVNPQAETIHIVDIAHHLSQVCRWAGATKSFYSVAQHSVLLTYIVPDHLQQWALLHDAGEAYIGDITRPLKNLLSEARTIESRIMEVIADRFKIGFPEPADLCEYDDQLIRFEAENMLENHDGDFVAKFGGLTYIAELTLYQRHRAPLRLMSPMSPQTAEIAFAMRFRELFPDYPIAIPRR